MAKTLNQPDNSDVGDGEVCLFWTKCADCGIINGLNYRRCKVNRDVAALDHLAHGGPGTIVGIDPGKPFKAVVRKYGKRCLCNRCAKKRGLV